MPIDRYWKKIKKIKDIRVVKAIEIAHAVYEETGDLPRICHEIPLERTYCLARKRTRDGYCLQKAGRRTNHDGQGVCSLHGGSSSARMYAKQMAEAPRIKELIERISQEEDPLDQLPEVILLRALVADLVGNFEETSAAVLAWSKETKKLPPRTLTDPAAAAKFLDILNKTIRNVQDAQRVRMLTAEGIQRLFGEYGKATSSRLRQVLAQRLPEVQEELLEGIAGEVLELVEKDWQQVRVKVAG